VPRPFRPLTKKKHLKTDNVPEKNNNTLQLSKHSKRTGLEGIAEICSAKKSPQKKLKFRAKADYGQQ